MSETPFNYAKKYYVEQKQVQVQNMKSLKFNFRKLFKNLFILRQMLQDVFFKSCTQEVD